MPPDDSTTHNDGSDNDPYATLVDRRDYARPVLDQAVAVINADAYLMTSWLPGIGYSSSRPRTIPATASSTSRRSIAPGKSFASSRTRWVQVA